MQVDLINENDPIGLEDLMSLQPRVQGEGTAGHVDEYSDDIPHPIREQSQREMAVVRDQRDVTILRQANLSTKMNVGPQHADKSPH